MKLLFSPACTLRFLERSHYEEPTLKFEGLYSTSWEEASIFLGIIFLGFPDSSLGKEFACNAGDSGSIPGSGRATGEGIGYPLQYSWGSLVTQLVKKKKKKKKTHPQCVRPGFNPWVGKSPGEGKGYPLQYSGLKNSTPWSLSRTRLSDFHLHFSLFSLVYIHRNVRIIKLVPLVEKKYV